MLVDILLGEFNIILKINRGCFSWLCFNRRVLGSRTLIVDFKSVGKAHAIRETSQQTSNPYCLTTQLHPTPNFFVGGYKEASTLVPWSRAKERQAYQEAGRVDYGILGYLLSHCTSNSLSLWDTVYSHIVDFNPVKEGTVVALGEKASVFKVLIKLWNSLPFLLRNSHLLRVECAEKLGKGFSQGSMGV